MGLVCPFPAFGNFRIDLITVSIIQEHKTFVRERETVVVDLVILHHRIQLVDFLSDTDNEIILDRSFSKHAGETKDCHHNDSKYC